MSSSGLKMRLFLVLLALLVVPAVCVAQTLRIPPPTNLPSFAIAGPQTYVYTARTAVAVRRSGAVTVATITWQCAQDTCTTSGPWPAPGVGACQALAGEVGVVIYYGRPGAVLNKNQLVGCNSHVARSTGSSAASPPAMGPSLSVRTPTLTLTGTGALASRGMFAPIDVRTPTLTMTGTGALAPRLPFAPVAVRTQTLTLTGAR
jgi:hypothetical protein